MEDLKELMKKAKEEAKKNKGNIKNQLVFRKNYIPPNPYIRQEAKQIIREIATFTETGNPEHMIILGYAGSGKTTTIKAILESDKTIKAVYINARETPTSYAIYNQISGNTTRGYSLNEVRLKALKQLQKSILAIDEADRLKDLDIIYTVSRETNTTLILLTQNISWYQHLGDPSISSSLTPKIINFAPYTPDEIEQILTQRAETGLKKYDKIAIRILSAYLRKDYNSDIRIGIIALERLGMSQDWEYNSITKECEEAGKENTAEIVKELTYPEQSVLKALIQDPETNKAITHAEVSKTTFFKITYKLQNMGIISLIRKKVNRSYTLETEFLTDTEALKKALEETQ